MPLAIEWDCDFVYAIRLKFYTLWKYEYNHYKQIFALYEVMGTRNAQVSCLQFYSCACHRRTYANLRLAY